MKPMLLIDFGSTCTKVTAVDREAGTLLGTAAAHTTVETDVNIGLTEALALLREKTGIAEFPDRMACSSAAGGLKMISCGLVPELTAEAARMASLGAGAKVLKTYAYQLTEEDAAEIAALQPDIFLLTGGTDGGNQKNILENAAVLATVPGDFPILIAGNRSAAYRCENILREAGKTALVCDNVMPRLGQLQIEPAQARIRALFLERIIHAKGLSEAQQLISGILMPTPAAVLAALELLAKGTANEPGIGDLVGIDLGGATTDVYSLSNGDPTEANTVLKGLPEPYAKRTVEGDIGMRYSAMGVAEAAGMEALCRCAGLSEAEVTALLAEITAHPEQMPDTPARAALDHGLASLAVRTAVARHAGCVEKVYTPVGETWLQEGKDLRAVSRVVVTGGALLHTPRVREIAAQALWRREEPASLRPREAEILVDRQYLLYAMGLLGQREPDIALKIMKKELLSYGTAKQEMDG